MPSQPKVGTIAYDGFKNILFEKRNPAILSCGWVRTALLYGRKKRMTIQLINQVRYASKALAGKLDIE